MKGTSAEVFSTCKNAVPYPFGDKVTKVFDMAEAF